MTGSKGLNVVDDFPVQFPKHYLDQLERFPESLAAMRELLDWAKDNTDIEFQPTGSRLFCEPGRYDHLLRQNRDPDFDVLVYVPRRTDSTAVDNQAFDGKTSRLRGLGWQQVAFNHDNASTNGRAGASVYKNNVNAILFHPNDEAVYRDWMRATMVCALLGGPMDREHRVQMFELIRSSRFSKSHLGELLGVTSDFLEDSQSGFTDAVRLLANTMNPPLPGNLNVQHVGSTVSNAVGGHY